jgi:hypothetical protein
MRKVVNDRKYNTETATEAAHWTSGHSCSDYRRCDETLFYTPKGGWFLYCTGGPMSKHAVTFGNGQSSGEYIVVLTDGEALDWCKRTENHGAVRDYW